MPPHSFDALPRPPSSSSPWVKLENEWKDQSPTPTERIPRTLSQEGQHSGGFTPYRRVINVDLNGGDGPSKQFLTLNDLLRSGSLPRQHGSGAGVLSSPLSKLMDKGANGSPSTRRHQGGGNYTFDITGNDAYNTTIFSTKNAERSSSFVQDTTVGPYDMEFKPIKKFDGLSTMFNAGFSSTKPKPFPGVKADYHVPVPPPVSTGAQSPLHHSTHLHIPSDDLTLSRFDTTFPEPRRIQDMFAFDDNYPSSSAPNTAGTQHHVTLSPSKQEPMSYKSPPPTLPRPNSFGSSQKQEPTVLPPLNKVFGTLGSPIRLPALSKLRTRKPMDYNVDRTALSQLSSLASSPMRYDASFGAQSGKRPRSASYSSPMSEPYRELRTKRRRGALAARSKSGCWTCRIRKKKCTEERPECSQCTRLGLKCDGYSIEKPEFLKDSRNQRKRLDEIKQHTMKSKKVGVRKVKVCEDKE